MLCLSVYPRNILLVSNSTEINSLRIFSQRELSQIIYFESKNFLKNLVAYNLTFTIDMKAYKKQLKIFTVIKMQIPCVVSSQSTV